MIYSPSICCMPDGNFLPPAYVACKRREKAGSTRRHGWRWRSRSIVSSCKQPIAKQSTQIHGDFAAGEALWPLDKEGAHLFRNVPERSGTFRAAEQDGEIPEQMNEWSPGRQTRCCVPWAKPDGSRTNCRTLPKRGYALRARR